jgi:hypothetical protein
MPDELLRESRDDDLAFSQSLTAADPLAAQTEKNEDGLIDALYIFGIEVPDAVSELIFWHCGDLINHESRDRDQGSPSMAVAIMVYDGNIHDA